MAHSSSDSTNPTPPEDMELESPDKSIELRDKYTADPVLIQAIRTKNGEKKEKRIRGLTLLDKELFVVHYGSSEIEIYDSMKLSLNRRGFMKKVTNPMDIVSCNRNKFLYIFNYKGLSKSNEICRVNPNGKVIKRWSTRGDNGWSLSVTDESNVILIVNTENKLNEYSPDGKWLREIDLSSEAGIRSPWHAIQLTNGHFVISHGGHRQDDLHRVCIVDADGDLVKSFGGEPGSTIGQLNYPIHLVVDGNGFVMVVDQSNGRVLSLDSDLKFKREILSKDKHGLREPRRILLDESTGRLFVVDNKENAGEIFIFQIK